MRHRILPLFFWILIQSLLFAANQTPPPPGPEKPLHLPQIVERKLSNGLLVIIAPLPNVPKVTAILSFQVGRATWRDQHPGVPSIAANVVTEGTTTKTSKQIQEELGSIGASINTSATEDATQLSGSTLSEFTEQYLSLLSDVVQHPGFPETEVDLAKQNMIQNIEAQRAEPDFLANERLRKEIFGDHPYSFLVPDEAAVEKITSSELKQFAGRYYIPNNAHLILVGDIQSAQGFAMVEKAFGSWKEGEPFAEKVNRPAARDKRQIYFVNRPGSIQSTISIGLATFPRKSTDYFPTRTADSIFGGSFSSRLTQNIREKRGYTYSPSSSNFTMAQSGIFSVDASVRNEVTGATLLEIFYEMDRMRVLPVTDEELKSAKTYQNGTFSIELAGQSDLASRIDTIYTYGLPHDFIQTFREKVNAVTLQDVQNASAKYFDTYRCAIVIVGDYAKVKDQVTPFGEVTVFDEKGNIQKGT